MEKIITTANVLVFMLIGVWIGDQIGYMRGYEKGNMDKFNRD